MSVLAIITIWIEIKTQLNDRLMCSVQAMLWIQDYLTERGKRITEQGEAHQRERAALIKIFESTGGKTAWKEKTRWCSEVEDWDYLVLPSLNQF